MTPDLRVFLVDEHNLITVSAESLQTSMLIDVCGDLDADSSRKHHVTDVIMYRYRQPFPSGQRVTYTGKEVLCQKCVQIPVRETQSPQASPSSTDGPGE